MAAGEPLSWSRRLDYKRMPPIDQCNGRTMAGTLVSRLRAGISRELGAHPFSHNLISPHFTLILLVWIICHGTITDESQRQASNLSSYDV